MTWIQGRKAGREPAALSADAFRASLPAPYPPPALGGPCSGRCESMVVASICAELRAAREAVWRSAHLSRKRCLVPAWRAGEARSVRSPLEALMGSRRLANAGLQEEATKAHVLPTWQPLARAPVPNAHGLHYCSQTKSSCITSHIAHLQGQRKAGTASAEDRAGRNA
jgi:hypothetical protein